MLAELAGYWGFLTMQIVRIKLGMAENPSAELVGGKAANLARMAALGLPVPPAFVLPVALCPAIVNGDEAAKQQLVDGLAEGIEFLERTTGKTVRRSAPAAVGLGALRRRAIDARNVGYRPQCWLSPLTRCTASSA